MKLLSIIVSVYNVEPYIRLCINSIFMQGLKDEDFEVIIINDGTEDNSMDVIADIIKQHPNISIIEQENQGLSVARNNGLARATGEYVFMPDPDDLLIENSLSILLKKALETKVDLAVADFLEMTGKEIAQYQGVTQNGFTITEKTGKEFFLEDLDPKKCYVWHILFRREFLVNNQIQFYPGIVYQDVPFTHECFIKAERCFKTQWLLNIYRKERKESATTTFTKKKALDFCIVIAKTWELTKQELPFEVQRKLKDDIYVSFYSMVYSSIYTFRNRSEVVEILEFLNQLAPDLRFNNNLKQRGISFLFRNMPNLYVQLLLSKSI